MLVSGPLAAVRGQGQLVQGHVCSGWSGGTLCVLLGVAFVALLGGVLTGAHWWLLPPLAAQGGCRSTECLVLVLPAMVIAFLLSGELERLEGGTLGTSPCPSVTHRKLSISQPAAQGLKAVKFPVSLCGERQPGFRWVNQQALGADSPWACQSLPIA